MRAKQKLAMEVRCPTCGAKPGEKCELSTGQPRNTPHRDRRFKVHNAHPLGPTPLNAEQFPHPALERLLIRLPPRSEAMSRFCPAEPRAMWREFSPPPLAGLPVQVH